MLANLCRSNNKPADCSTLALPLYLPLPLFLCQSYTLPLERICMQIRWISLCASVCVSLSLSVCVQSKVSNNVSGRMCLAIEIYLHYYSVLTMRLGSSPICPPYLPLPISQSSPYCLRSSLSLLRSLWVARQLVKPCLRQHGAKPAPRGSICRLASVAIFARVALLFSLLSAVFRLQPSLCSLLLGFDLRSSVFRPRLPELLSSFSYQDSIRAA